MVMGSDQSPLDTYIQATGTGQRISAAKLRGAMDQSARLHRSPLAYAFAFHLQTAQTALSHRRNTTEERLARWLLMVEDRLDGGELPLTQAAFNHAGRAQAGRHHRGAGAGT